MRSKTKVKSIHSESAAKRAETSSIRRPSVAPIRQSMAPTGRSMAPNGRHASTRNLNWGLDRRYDDSETSA